MQAFKAMEAEVHAALADRSGRASHGNQRQGNRHRRLLGYNVQTAVDAQHHLIVAHDVTNVGHDRDQLSNMAGQAKAVMGVEALDVLADRGYFKGEEVLACAPLSVTPYVPNRSPQDPRLRAGSANRTSSTSLKRTPIAVRPTSV